MSSTMLARKSEAAPAAKTATPTRNVTTSLRIGAPDDAFEQEADRMADAVMNGGRIGADWSFSRMSVEAPLQRKCDCGGAGGASGECTECKEKRLQRKATGARSQDETPPIVHQVLNSSGRPLDATARRFFEPRFGYDFSGVRLHTDARAAESARSVNALAYTVGQDIVLDPGVFSKESAQGKRLLAHELSHTIQQSDCRHQDQQHFVAERQGESDRRPSLLTGMSSDFARHDIMRVTSPRLQRASADPSVVPKMNCNHDEVPGGGAGMPLIGVSLKALSAAQTKQIAEFHKKWVASGSSDFIAVEGYASPDTANDSADQQKANWRYSCHRAELVQAEFVKLGVPQSRVITFAHGETDKFSTKDPAQNRRVEISTVRVAGPAPAPAAPAVQVPGGFSVGEKGDGVSVKPTAPKVLPAPAPTTAAPSTSNEPGERPDRLFSVTLEFDLKNDWKSPTPPPPTGTSPPFLCDHGVLQIGGKWNSGITIFKDRLELLNEPELDINVAPAFCGNNVGVTAQMNLIKFTILKDIIEADLVPVVGLPDGWATGLSRFPFTGGGQVKLQSTPFARLSPDFKGLKIGLFGGIGFEQGVPSDAAGAGTAVKTLGGFIGLDYDVGPAKKKEDNK